MSTATLRACGAIVVLSAIFYGTGIGAGSHFNSDDALYAQMAREQAQSGDYVDNRWLGVVHFEKPPLLLWSLAASGRVFGFGEAALRAPVTAFAIAALCAFFLLARELGVGWRAAYAATGLLAGSTFYLLMTRRLMTDMPLLCCALWCALLVVKRRGVASGCCAGLALLAKGPAALPLLAAAYGFGLLTRALGLRQLLAAALAALAVAAPWHVLVSLRHGGEFWAGYLGHHVIARMQSAVVPGLSLPELAAVLARERVLLALGALGLVAAVRRRFATPAQRFAGLWLIAVALPLVLSTTRLPHYLLPLAPAFALLAVTCVPQHAWQHRLAPLIATCAVLAALIADPAKLQWWLDPDFSPDEKALGLAIGRAAGPRDLAGAYNFGTASLVFYSAGRPIAMYSDDARFIAVQNAVLMVQRQAGKPGGLHDLREAPLPAAAGRRFLVARRDQVERALRLLRAQAPARPLYRLDAGELALLNDAGVGAQLEASGALAASAMPARAD